jgi:Uma2 family endonuclease
MSPSQNHEAIKTTIGHLVGVFCMERGVPFKAVGSWTLHKKKLKKGVEPDECFVFGERARARTLVPDLAVEVVWTSGGMEKFPIYQALGVSEVWVWRRSKLVPYVLRATGYKAVKKSRVLPGIDLTELAACTAEPLTSDAITRFRAHLR